MQGFGNLFKNGDAVNSIIKSHGPQLKAWAKTQIGKKITIQTVQFFLINGLGFNKYIAIMAAAGIVAYLSKHAH